MLKKLRRLLTDSCRTGDDCATVSAVSAELRHSTGPVPASAYSYRYWLHCHACSVRPSPCPYHHHCSCQARSMAFPGIFAEVLRM